ncbi:MAG: zinc ribbon domain-containing protein [Oscillospiraceae bacterium]|nr:zinc ribbon domain-containing protein [Oscillospiraceae bacterium]
MYCVKCGVRLQDGVKSCPLCGTPVWDPSPDGREPHYPSDYYPKHYSESLLPLAVILTAFTFVLIAATLIVCFNLYHSLSWGGYVVFGALLVYIVFVLPLWFRCANPLVFIPVCHAAAAGYVLYICLKTGGHWFLSFAMPMVLLSLFLTMALYCLLRYVKHGRYFIIGGFVIVLGGVTLLIEFFEHIAFGLAMFRWSPFSAGCCVLIGILILLVGTIRPLREEFDKRFFL